MKQTLQDSFLLMSDKLKNINMQNCKECYEIRRLPQGAGRIHPLHGCSCHSGQAAWVQVPSPHAAGGAAHVSPQAGPGCIPSPGPPIPSMPVPHMAGSPLLGSPRIFPRPADLLGSTASVSEGRFECTPMWGLHCSSLQGWALRSPALNLRDSRYRSDVSPQIHLLKR